MRTSALAILALLVVASTASAQSVPRVFILGDSQTAGLGPVLSRELRQDGVPVAGYLSRHGWSTERYERQGDLRSILETHGRPEVLVVELGGNDFVSSREAYLRQMDWIVSQAHAAGVRDILWIGPASSDPRMGENAATTDVRHARNAELQSQMLPELGVRWIDSRPFTHEHHVHDGVHFTEQGYERWGGSVLGSVLQTVQQYEQGQ